MKIMKLGLNPNTEHYFVCHDCGTIYMATEKELHDLYKAGTPNTCPNCTSADIGFYSPTSEEMAEWTNWAEVTHAVPTNASISPADIAELKDTAKVNKAKKTNAEATKETAKDMPPKVASKEERPAKTSPCGSCYTARRRRYMNGKKIEDSTHYICLAANLKLGEDDECPVKGDANRCPRKKK